MKILILGIGDAQVDPIKYCKKLEVEVYTCSYIEQGRGKDLADAFALIDINNSDQIKRFVSEKQIDVIYTIGSDIAMPTITKVSSALGLSKFNTTNTAKICQDKGKLRATLGKNFKGNPKWETFTNISEIKKWKHFPCVIKPVDNQGQRGVFFVKNKVTLSLNFSKSILYSRSNEVIIEEYINGPEISVNAYFFKRNLIFFQITDRITFSEYPFGIVKEHKIPSLYTKFEDKIHDLVIEIAKILKIQDGPVYFQMKIEQGKPKLIEVTPRLDGCHLWRLIKYYNNVDLLDITFKHLLYNKKPEIKIQLTSNKFMLRFMYEKPNTRFHNNKFKDEKYLYSEFYYKENQVIREINGHMEKVGYLIKVL